MATELQFNIFRSLYDEELQRTNNLRTTGQIHLGACTFLIGGLLFKYKDLTEGISGGFETAILYLGFLFLALANIMALWSLGIFRYEYFSDPNSIFKQFGEKAPRDEEFLDDRIADLSVAFNRNRETNNKRAKIINFSSAFLIVGTVMVFMIFILIMR